VNALRTLRHKTKYRGQWQLTSDHLRSQGCYEWMAEQLNDLRPRNILDIGCGSGNGLLALIARFAPSTLISLEENIDCIDATVEALVEAGECPLAYPRLSYNLDAATITYDLDCSDAPVQLKPGISIVQTDVGCTDPPLSEALEGECPFDAITVWLIGTDALYLRTVGSTPSDYRRQIQHRIYELADRWLRPGGWIQFVDRGPFPLTSEQQGGLVQDHEALLESTRLKFLKFSERPYEEAGEGGIPLAIASGQIGGTARGLMSIISWLPDVAAEQ
jgi:SAM-dependent methyltransferase